MSVLQTVEAHVEAFNDRDLERIVALFAQDAVFATAEQLVVGRRGLRALFADAFAQPLTAALSLRRAVVDGEHAACELAERLELPGAAPVELDVAGFYTVRDGALTRVRIYRDLAGT